MAEPIRIPAPDAVGDIVAGEPPVPITVWHVPAPHPGDTMSITLADRLVRNFTHGRRLVLDLTSGEQLARAARAARRRHARHTPQDLSGDIRRASLVVAGWPLERTEPVPFLADCAQRVMAGGCVAMVLGAAELTVNQVLIAAARAAGLTYLQHIVAAHDLTGQRGQLGDGGTHLSVHSDVLVFSSSQDALRGSADG
ncbi:hypothetical protein KIF24_17005 [Micromonospora sp. Llam7]|uniref:hypothetical protein n=1 Tax=Micromonospora tarapacensis TaxID=2835305 RepID=UPI001C82F824|nr:hypothetical protein [Micromonospora tarapacensis]MBX7267563.1 hypothetical protein [Micromonospora tarapacensis]